MNLKEQIQKDFITGMKEKDANVKSALSGLKSKITEAEKINGNEINDDGIIKVIVAAIKQRKQSFEEFTKGNRPELAEKEQNEINILEKYLPLPMTKLEIEKALIQILSENTMDVTNKQRVVGQTIGHFNKKFQGRADNAIVKSIIEHLLGF